MNLKKLVVQRQRLMPKCIAKFTSEEFGDHVAEVEYCNSFQLRLTTTGSLLQLEHHDVERILNKIDVRMNIKSIESGKYSHLK